MSSFTRYTTSSNQQLFKQLSTGPEGLTPQQATNILQKNGLNQLNAYRFYWWHIFIRQFRSPFIYLLLGAAVLSFLLQETLDGSLILLFLGINTLLGFYQEYRSEKTLALLGKYLVATVTVIRAGQKQLLDVTHLVVGDVVILVPGMIVPADLRLIDHNNLVVDESVLTGESVPATKQSLPLTNPAVDIYSAKNICFSSTTIVGGEGLGVVIATGTRTNYGDIARLTSSSHRSSAFEHQLATFSRFTLGLVLTTLCLLIIANLVIKRTPSLPELLLFSVALAVSVIPEALPVVTTFSLSLGALKLAKKHVVVKRLSAIEDLGSIEVLCSDKTGTLTENKLTVDSLFTRDIPKTLFYGALAASEKINSPIGINPFSNALSDALTSLQRAELQSFVVEQELPFDPLRKRVSKVIRRGELRELVNLGAPEELLRLIKPQPSITLGLTRWITEQGKKGKRVLAVTIKTLTKPPNSIAKSENDMMFLGAIAFIDPIKPSTISAISEARALGVKIKILTGDSKEVAGNVAEQIGLISDSHHVITGDEFKGLSPLKQQAAVNEFSVFSRITPQLKYKIVKLLEEKWAVGYLGEGINDAPALKVANVALVVAHSSDIAKEAADIVLLKRSLHVIIEGIREGRNVFVNTTKYITATLAANFGNFFAVSLASLLIDFLPMLPLQILLVNLLSDFPMIAVATDRVDASSAYTPSRFDFRQFALISLTLGLVSTLFDFIFFGVFVPISAPVLQTAWFMGSIMTELLFIFSVRTKLLFFRASRPSTALLLLTFVAFIITLLLPYTYIGQHIFAFQPLTFNELYNVIIIVFCYFVSTEAVKLLYYKFVKQ